MSVTKALTSNEFYEIYKNEVISRASDIVDFNEGSLQDISTGAMTTALNEVSELLLNEFLKTFFGSAKAEHLEYLAVDHFGSRFARPESTSSTVTITFSRPNNDAGDVLIDDTVIVKTKKDANGEEVRFKVDTSATMTGLTLNVAVTSVESGANTKVLADKVIEIESALTDDTIIVTNVAASAGGENEQDDDEYRETISNLLLSLAGATEAAIKGAVQAIAEITYVSVVTTLQKVRNVDDFGVAYGDTFRIPYVKVYVADADGNYSDSLLELADNVILYVRAAGVKIVTVGALSVEVDWSAGITLNPAGPNYAILSEDTSMIEDDMSNYIDEGIDIGEGFNRTTANAYILSIWGPAGTGDLTSFVTNTPTGNVAGVAGTKLISGTVEVA